MPHIKQACRHFESVLSQSLTPETFTSYRGEFKRIYLALGLFLAGPAASLTLFLDFFFFFHSRLSVFPIPYPSERSCSPLLNFCPYFLSPSRPSNCKSPTLLSSQVLTEGRNRRKKKRSRSSWKKKTPNLPNHFVFLPLI